MTFSLGICKPFPILIIPSLFQMNLFGWLFSCCHRPKRDTAHTCTANNPQDCQPIQSQSSSIATTIVSADNTIPIRDMFPRTLRSNTREPITADNLHAQAAELNRVNSVYNMRKTNSRRAAQSYFDTCIGIAINTNPASNDCDHIYSRITSKVGRTGLGRISQYFMTSAFGNGKSKATPGENGNFMVSSAKEINKLNLTGPVHPIPFSAKGMHADDDDIVVVSNNADSDCEESTENLPKSFRPRADATCCDMVDSMVRADICYEEKFHNQQDVTAEVGEEVESVVSADSFVSVDLKTPPSGDSK